MEEVRKGGWQGLYIEVQALFAAGDGRLPKRRPQGRDMSKAQSFYDRANMRLLDPVV